MIHIIGGSGFIGSRLSSKLITTSHNYEFCIVDKNLSREYPDKCRIADVRSVEDLEKQLDAGSILVNLAAEHRDDVFPLSLYQDVNVGGAENICRVARDKNIETIVFTSTVAVYGFAAPGTDEFGAIAPFNEYGRTKYEAELVFRRWQTEVPNKRRLVIIRPTVVFGERNRGNVYNLLRQIASKAFVMVGKGENSKSMAYVENIAAFILYTLSFPPGLHIYNYVDKPDLQVKRLIAHVFKLLGRKPTRFVIPKTLGFAIGRVLDLIANLTGKRFPVSYIRVKKFCADSMFATSVEKTGFKAPVSLNDALKRTVEYEFLNNDKKDKNVFYTE